MARFDDRSSGMARRWAGLGIFITLLALVLVAAFGSASGVRGTSEAVGYPPMTPVTVPPTVAPTLAPPTAVATATSVPPTPVPPTATPVLPTATVANTVVPPTNTVPPATATATATSTISPTATLPATPAHTATPRISLVAVKMSMALGSTNVAQGQTMTVTVHAAPRRHVSYVASYIGLRPQTDVRGIVQADARGIVSFSVRVVPGPSKGATSLSGSIIARSADANTSGATSARFRVFPALHLVTGSRIVTKNGAMTMVVRVQVAVRAQVLVTMTVSGMRPPAVTARGTVDGQHRLDLSLALGILHGPAEAHIVVVVTTKDGVTATQNVSVMVRS